MTTVKSLDESNFEDFMKRQDEIKVLRFWATWCGPCIALEPIYNDVARELQSAASFGEVDIDKAPQIAGAFRIRSVPTVLVFKGDQLADMIVGLNPKSRYIEAVGKAA